MKVLAFDQATSVTGWAVGNETSKAEGPAENRFHFGAIKSPKREEFGERLAFIWREMTVLVEIYKPDLIGFEEPFFPIQGRGGAKQAPKFKAASGFLPAEINQNQVEDDAGGSRFNPETLKQLQMVKGLVITLAALRGIPVEGCHPSQWRMSVLGYGRKPKNEDEQFMKRAVRQYFENMGMDIPGHDVSDAIGILWHTLHGPAAEARKQGDLLDMVGGSL